MLVPESLRSMGGARDGTGGGASNDEPEPDAKFAYFAEFGMDEERSLAFPFEDDLEEPSMEESLLPKPDFFSEVLGAWRERESSCVGVGMGMGATGGRAATVEE